MGLQAHESGVWIEAPSGAGSVSIVGIGPGAKQAAEKGTKSGYSGKKVCRG
jgi:hypothetical protein